VTGVTYFTNIHTKAHVFSVFTKKKHRNLFDIQVTVHRDIFL